MIAELMNDTIKLAKEATDRTKEIFSTGDVLIFGAFLFYIFQVYFFFIFLLCFFVTIQIPC